MCGRDSPERQMSDQRRHLPLLLQVSPFFLSVVGIQPLWELAVRCSPALPEEPLHCQAAKRRQLGNFYVLAQDLKEVVFESSQAHPRWCEASAWVLGIGGGGTYGVDEEAGWAVSCSRGPRRSRAPLTPACPLLSGTEPSLSWLFA